MGFFSFHIDSPDFCEDKIEIRPENYFEVKNPEKSAKSGDWVSLLLAEYLPGKPVGYLARIEYGL